MPIVSHTKGDTVTATVSLSDCLSCSGCLTSSEEVLLSSQGVQQLKTKLAEAEKDRKIVLVASLSLPVIVSFARAFLCDLDSAYRKLIAFLSRIGVKYVFDTRFAHEIVQHLIVQELRSRTSDSGIPLICGECPAWVLYAYKKLAAEKLPALSLVKSQQRVMGVLLKTVMRERILQLEKLPPETEIFHVAICQCNDKKVESVLNVAGKTHKEGKREIDIALTARELLEYMTKECKVDFASLSNVVPAPAIDEFLSGPTESMSKAAAVPIKSVPNGYFRAVYSAMTGAVPELKPCGNKDMRQAQTGKFRAALVGGYRNIQKVLAMLKQGKRSFDYIELYSCPGECWGGAGLLETKEKLAEVMAKETAATEKGWDVEGFLKRNPAVAAMLISEKFQKAEEKVTVSSVAW